MTEHLGQVTDKSWLSGETLFESRLKDWARKHGIAFLNLTPFFRASAQEGTLLNFRVDQHWNVAGHKLAAEKIWQWMIEN